MPSKPILLPQCDIFQSETGYAKKKNKIEDGDFILSIGN